MLGRVRDGAWQEAVHSRACKLFLLAPATTSASRESSIENTLSSHSAAQAAPPATANCF